MDIALGENSLGEKLINADLIFEVETQPQGLNDRAHSKTVVIPRQDIIGEEISSQTLAKKITEEYGKDISMFS